MWHEKDIECGSWSSDEIESLKAAVREVSGTEDLASVDVDGTSWSDVAALVPSRNISQCRIYWGERLSTQLRGAEWRREDMLRLITVSALERFHNYVRMAEGRYIEWNHFQVSAKRRLLLLISKKKCDRNLVSSLVRALNQNC